MNKWVHSDGAKAELFAQHLASVFQPNEINSDINTTINYQTRQIIKHVTPVQVAKVISKAIRRELTKLP